MPKVRNRPTEWEHWDMDGYIPWAFWLALMAQAVGWPTSSLEEGLRVNWRIRVPGLDSRLCHTWAPERKWYPFPVLGFLTYKRNSHCTSPPYVCNLQLLCYTCQQILRDGFAVKSTCCCYKELEIIFQPLHLTLPVTLAPGCQTPSAGLLEHLHSHAYSQTQVNIHETIIKSLKSKN